MKKINKKIKVSSKIKFLFVSMGPGETSQARALAKFIFKKGGKIIFALHQKINFHFLEKDKNNFEIFLTESPSKLNLLIKTKRPDVLLFFNSKTWGRHQEFQQIPPSPKPLTLCVDSNWLFNDKKYPFFNFIKWADNYLINIPEKIFNFGLKENGGNFVISSQTKNKIKIVGLIPYYRKISFKERLNIRKKYKIKGNEKFIFSYFSGFGAGHRIWAFDNLLKATEKIIKKGLKIKLLYLGPTDNINPEKLKKDWIILKNSLSSDEFYSVLASCDLIFQHQGLATLSQAISAQIPVIANVARQPKASLPKIHFWEVEPFKKAGVCSLLSKSTPIDKIAKEIIKLLYDSLAIKKMREVQKKYCVPGEIEAYKIIKELLINKNK
ncbi:MAG: hypothetical protein NTU58_02200 [Candidatus Nealsonbacteria bacterium]|nr:hypothetical protein [Candidatus Nealsonbacteria bacterium]